MSRLFLAVPLPTQVRRRLARLRCELGGARWVPEEQLHLTLRFLGDVEDPSELVRALSARAASWPAVRMRLQGVGRFGSPKRPRVLFAGVLAGEPLDELQRHVEAAAVEAGLGAEARPFSPHITLARLKRPDVTAVTAFVRAHAGFRTEAWAVTEVVLFRSVLRPHGAVHEAVERFELPALSASGDVVERESK